MVSRASLPFVSICVRRKIALSRLLHPPSSLTGTLAAIYELVGLP